MTLALWYELHEYSNECVSLHLFEQHSLASVNNTHYHICNQKVCQKKFNKLMFFEQEYTLQIGPCSVNIIYSMPVHLVFMYRI